MTVVVALARSHAAQLYLEALHNIVLLNNTQKVISLTWQQSWRAAFGHWALTVAASLSNLWYLRVQLYPVPSEAQRSRAATTMKNLRAAIVSWAR